MSTFRQEQIQEILNYERAMNRIVLDKEIAQVSRFNDERNPPSNRDIKFEAILGNLIDALKAKIAEALTSIASEQYPKNDASTATRLLDLKSGEDGSNARYVNQKTKKTAQELQGEYEKNYNNQDAPSNEGTKEETNQVGVPQTEEVKQDIKEENEKKEERGEGPADNLNAVQLPATNVIDEENKYATPPDALQEPIPKLKIMSREQTMESEKQMRKASVVKAEEEVITKIDEMNALNEEYHKRGKPIPGANIGEYEQRADKLFKELIKNITSYTLSRKFNALKGDYDEGVTLPLPNRLAVKLIDNYFHEIADEFYQNKMREINEIINNNKKIKSGKGKPNRFEKPKGYFGRGEKDGETRTSLEEEKSRTQHVKATENVLYDIITQYNGIIDKINQVTMPDGRFASRRTVSQQSIGFYSDVLKGLLEPIKHLIFELTSVRNPQLATTLNMMTSMKELIEMAPPFQKINITAYKNGLPDFQGLNGEVTIDVNGYLSDLTEYLTNIRRMKNNVDHQLNSVLFNLKDQSIRDSVLESLKKKTEYYKELVGRIEKEIETVKARKRITDELEVNTQLIKDARDMFNNLEEFLTAPPPVEQDFIDILNKKPVLPGNESEYGYLIRTQLRNANDRIQTLEAYRNKYLKEYGDDYKDDELDEEISKLTIQKGRLQEKFSRFVAAIPETTDIVPYYQNEEKKLKTSGKNPTEKRAVILQTPGYDYEVKKLTKEKGIPTSLGYKKGRKKTAVLVQELQAKTGKGKPDIGSGGTAGLADYLSTDAKPQYWHHRELPDDNKIHKQVVKNNEDWQKFSNPPHTNPVGSLYPFNKKSEAEKYSFPLKLKHDLAILKPDDTQKDARGADISLLQGPIAPTVEEKMPKRRESRRTQRTAKEAMNNILLGKGMESDRNIGAGYEGNPWYEAMHKYGEGKKQNSKALHKIVFDDEDNEQFDDENYAPDNGGMIPEEEPEETDRFRNKKLGPMKKKSVKK